ncbi:MAG: hypothetical protein GY866_10370 [Proteobacteria bacterium]|nr:hypothetical protein [Pseudomonadota bacterium]
MKQLFACFLILLLFSSCQLGQEPRRKKKVEISCAETRLAASFDFHEKAMDFFQSFYKTRKESVLFYAWYASEDSVYMANSVRKCYDKKNKHFHAVKNLFTKNGVLQRLIVQNMRQNSQAQLSELFLDEYRRIFVRDIQ